MRPGTLALVGGSEHGPGCELADRALLAATGARRPLVAVLPFASSLRTRARTVGRAVAWWHDLGAVSMVVAPEPDVPSPVVAHADLVVLTGGVPDRLHARLLGTPLWAQIVDRWRDGAALSGSSSGAMVLGEARQSVRPPFRVLPAGGLLPGVAVAPHHQQTVPGWLAAVRARTHPHLTILGLDDATALLRQPDGAVRVLGRGELTVRRGAHLRRFVAGCELDPLDVGLWTPPVPAEVPATEPVRRPQAA